MRRLYMQRICVYVLYRLPHMGLYCVVRGVGDMVVLVGVGRGVGTPGSVII